MQTSEDDALVDRVFHAYPGTVVVHDVTTAADTDEIRCLVLVNEGVPVPRLLHHENHLLWVVPPVRWEEARQGQLRQPSGFSSSVVRSFYRRPEHDDQSARVELLELTNFRCFEHLSVSLHDTLNVLIGRNGAGKTAILDAIAMGLMTVVKRLHTNTGASHLSSSFRPKDIRLARIDKNGVTNYEPQYPANGHLGLHLQGRTLRTSRSFRDMATTPPRDFRRRRPADERRRPSDEPMRWAVQDGFDVTLPLIAYYPSNRTWRGEVEGAAARQGLSRLDGYEGCLEPSTSLSSMLLWFQRMELLAHQESGPPPVLEACKRAIFECLEGFDSIRYDARIADLAARSSKTGMLLAFKQLSDGQKSVLGMVADMAFRAATLNPHLGADAAAQTPGIVLIDEIDLHLHPAWQRRVIPDLRRAFPKVQFIITTHSPQVLSEVPTESVIVLDDSQAYRPAAPTEGRDSNSILAEVLGVSPHPKETVAELEAIAHLIDDGNDAEARTRLDALAERLTERDPEVSRLRGILDVVERIDAGDHEGA